MLTTPNDLLTAFHKSVAQLCQSYNVPTFDLREFFLNKEPLNIVALPRAFQPGGEFFDESYAFVGSCVPAQRTVVDFPYERLGQQPIIYISLGTVFNTSSTFFRTCLNVFRGMDQHVVIACGDRVDIASLGPIPDHIIIQPYVPQLDLLRRSRLFITHAGMNGVLEALTLGVPMLMIPQMLEQTMNARQVVAQGSGIILEKEQVTQESLGDAIAQMLGDQRYTERAHDLSKVLGESHGPQQAADVILAHAHSMAQS
jgi:MGT family glycosyltransferase